MTSDRRSQIEQLELRTLFTAIVGSTIHTEAAAGPLPVQTVPPVASTGIGITIHEKAGVPFTHEVAFYRSPVLDPPDAYSATINWGDGLVSQATLAYGLHAGISGYQISGSHLYAKPGTFTITTTLLIGPISSPTAGATQTPTTVVTTILSKAIVTALRANSVGGVTLTEPADQSFTAAIGSFTTAAPATGLTATINWGDGTTSAGQLAPVSVVGANANELTFDVIGTHTYALTGTYPVRIVVDEPSPVAAGAAVQVAVIRSRIISQLGISLAGTISGTSRVVDNLPTGRTYGFQGAGNAGDLGSVTAKGTITVPGIVGSTKASGTLTLSNADGSVTLALTGPTESPFGLVPSTLSFTIASATGIYFDDIDSGTITTTLTPSSGATPGTFTFVIS